MKKQRLKPAQKVIIILLILSIYNVHPLFKTKYLSR